MDCICDKFVMVEDGEVFEMTQAAKGDPGPGVAPGGTTGQLLAKASDTDYDTEWIDQPEMDAGHVEYDATEAYDDGTVGKELTTINSALTSLQSVTEIIDTASGAIASFPDGAGLPMRSLLAQINPVQDLHGYDAPWAGGAGKNLFDPTANPNKWINASGQLTTVTGAKASQQIPCAQGDTFTVSTESGISTLAICFYASDDSVTQRTAQQDSASLTATAPANTAYVRSATYGESGKEVQLEKGSSKTSFLPYANECPITGWTGLSGERDGKNLLNPDSSAWVDGKNIDASGQIIDSTSARYYRNFLKCNGGESISFQYTQTTSAAGVTCAACFYDAGMGFIERKAFFSYGETKVGLNSGTTTAPSNARYFTVIMQRNLQYTSNVQCEFSSTPTDCEAYTTLPITCTWQTEAGTVYDGYIDVVSGELVATHGVDTYNGSENWGSDGITSGVAKFYVRNDAIKKPDSISGTYVGKIFANNLPTTQNNYRGVVGGATSAAMDHPKTLCMQDLNGIRFMVYDTSWGGVANFNAYVAQNPIQIVYKLAQPLVYHLSPQQISTLLGNNTVFVDTGSVSVTYQASIKGYIDKVLAS